MEMLIVEIDLRPMSQKVRVPAWADAQRGQRATLHISQPIMAGGRFYSAVGEVSLHYQLILRQLPSERHDMDLCSHQT